MEVKSFCRSCLVTDVELCDMSSMNLIEPYEILTGIKVSQTDLLSHYMCGCCRVLLLKCVWFKDKCKKAEDILNTATQIYDVKIQEKFLKTIDRSGLKLGLKLSSSHLEKISYPIDLEKKIEIVIKEEIADDYFNDDFFMDNDTPVKLESPVNGSLSDQSDEEKLSVLAKKNSLKKLDTNKKTVKKEFRKKRVKKTISKKDADNPWMDMTSKSDNDPVLLDKLDTTFKVLTKEEAISELQSRKKSLNYIRCLFKCEKCYKGFQTQSTLNNHMSIHDARMGNLECDVCFQRYSNNLRLRYHIKKTHLYRYICRQCGTSSKTIFRAKLHYKWHLGFTYNCKICGASFKKTTTYFTHVRLMHPSSKYKCTICDASFVSDKGLQHHNNMRHSQITPASTTCSYCQVKFNDEAALKEHQQSVGEGLCNADTKSCQKCGVGFKTEDELKNHSQTHSKPKSFKCPICNKMLSSHKTLGQHYETIHLGIKRGVHENSLLNDGSHVNGTIVCEICGKICSNKHVYISHQRQHTGEKPYQCSLCPMKFCQLQNLQIHTRTHTGERPYQCDQCDKSFRSKACVNRHSRVHTGAKPYACPHCGKTFTQTNSVKLHINTVHFKMPQPYRNRRKQQ